MMRYTAPPNEDMDRLIQARVEQVNAAIERFLASHAKDFPPEAYELVYFRGVDFCCILPKGLEGLTIADVKASYWPWLDYRVPHILVGSRQWHHEGIHQREELLTWLGLLSPNEPGG